MVERVCLSVSPQESLGRRNAMRLEFRVVFLVCKCTSTTDVWSTLQGLVDLALPAISRHTSRRLLLPVILCV
jgi:hypothetical protein